MKKLCLLALVILAGSVSSYAKTFKMGGDTPFVSLTVPDSWNMDGSDTSIAGSDHGAFLSADTASGKGKDTMIDDCVDFLTKQGVVGDDKTLKQTTKEINGLTVTIILEKGKDADGPANIGLIVVPLPNDKALVLTYWGPDTEDKALDADMTSILASITAL